ncbi:iron-containing alcohol dehydrogenase [Desulfocurvus sp. DL9XJH121]
MQHAGRDVKAAEVSQAMHSFLAPEFVFGPGASLKAGEALKGLGARRVLVVTMADLRGFAWHERCLGGLAEAGIGYVVYDSVSQNPRDTEVMAGAEFYKTQGCDAILGLGGGSPLDCAKAIGVVVTNNRHVLDFEGQDKVEKPGPPLVCVPSTAGSAAEVSQFAIITDTERWVKIAIISKTMIPHLALVDPDVTMTMPPSLTANTGLDVLTHAMEAYVSRESSPVTRLFSLETVRLVGANLARAVADGGDRAAREAMMLASMYAGLGFSNAILGAVHSMAHSLGGHADLPHGLCNALLLDVVAAFNFDSAPELYMDVTGALGVEVAGLDSEQGREALIEAVRSLKRAVGVDKRLSALGVSSKDLDKLAELALNDPCMATNPRKPTLEDVRRLFEQAM